MKVTFVCFTCRTRTTQDGAGTTQDPYVTAEHDTSDGERCGQSGSRWVAA